MDYINVIELESNLVIKLVTFPIYEPQLSHEVVDEAENLFREFLKEYKPELSDEAMEDFVEDGVYFDQDYSVQLMWSNS